jgi:hypothetical protein
MQHALQSNLPVETFCRIQCDRPQSAVLCPKSRRTNSRLSRSDNDTLDLGPGVDAGQLPRHGRRACTRLRIVQHGADGDPQCVGNQVPWVERTALVTRSAAHFDKIATSGRSLTKCGDGSITKYASRVTAATKGAETSIDLRTPGHQLQRLIALSRWASIPHQPASGINEPGLSNCPILTEGNRAPRSNVRRRNLAHQSPISPH